MTPAALRVDVRQRFASGFHLAAALDVSVPAGSILVVFGPSGAGKTTILRHIAGLERPDAGTIAFDEQVWCDTTRGVWQPPQARRVGVVIALLLAVLALLLTARCGRGT